MRLSVALVCAWFLLAPGVHAAPGRRPLPGAELCRTQQGGRAKGQLLRRIVVNCKLAAHRLKQRFHHHKDHVWLGSSVSLGASQSLADSVTPMAARLGRRGAARLGSGMRALGAVGAAGLLLTASHDLLKAQSAHELMDAGSDLAWGSQGMASLVEHSTFTRIAQGLGVVGGLCQIGAGCHRILVGRRQHDRSQIKLGMLDVAGGSLWIGWDLAGFSNPWFIGGYAAVMVGREAYANRDALKSLGRRAGEKVRCAYGACKQRIKELFHPRQAPRGTLRHLAAGLD